MSYCPNCGHVLISYQVEDVADAPHTRVFKCEICTAISVAYTSCTSGPEVEAAIPVAKVFMQGLETFISKNHDYGNSWRTHGLIGVLIRIHDKLQRFTNLTKNGRQVQVNDEGVLDTIKDNMVYSAMALSLRDEIEWRNLR